MYWKKMQHVIQATAHPGPTLMRTPDMSKSSQHTRSMKLISKPDY